MSTDARPNVLLVTSHDLGRHLGCYGVDTVDAPAVDRLASEGVRFDNTFATNPICSPSRASIATGQYPQSCGVFGLTSGNFAWDVADPSHHVAAVLSERGWRSALVGVGHELRDPSRAFDAVPFDGTSSGGNHCDAVAAAATDVLEAAGPEPFFLQVGFYEPHRRPGTDSGWGEVPEVSPDDVTIPAYLRDTGAAREEFAAFEGAIRRMDGALGRVLDALGENGLAEDTIVLFTADHGIPFPRAKTSPYDPGHRISHLLRWPGGGLVDGDPVDALVSAVDYAPTLYDLLGVEVPGWVDGRSFADVLAGRTTEHRDRLFGEITYHSHYDPRRWVRTGAYKVIVNFEATKFYNSTQSWRPKTDPVVPRDPGRTVHDPVEVYDLEADPDEFENVVDDVDPDTLAGLLSDLRGWMRRVDDPLLDAGFRSPMHESALATLERGVPQSPGER